MVRELTQEQLQSEIIDAKKTTLVDFWASWCGPCKALAPILDDISKDTDFEGKLDFGKISTEDYPEVAGANNVSGIPCLILFENGTEKGRIIGFHPKSALKAKIAELL
jgi:thioredoxin 1